MNINNYKFADATGNPLNTGGLVGSFTGNTLSYGYFAGSILDKCNYTTLTDCKIGNVIGDDAGTTVSNIFTSHPLINKGGRNETPINYSTDLRAQTSFSTTLNSFNSDTGSGCNIDPCWYHTDKDLPRLAFETHDCSDNLNLLDIFSQAGTLGRGGSESNPIIICTQDQLRAIGNTAQSLSWHYMLKDHLLVGDFTSDRIGPVYGENAGTLKRIVSNTEVRIDSMTYGTCLAPAPDDPTCTGTYGGFWTGAECLVSATDESSCTGASSIWYPTNLFHAVASIRGTTDTTNGIYHTIDPYLSLLETTTSACAVNGSFLELTVTNASAYDLSLTTKHVILGNFEAKGTLSAQIAGPKLKVLASQFGGDCTQINNMITNNGGSLSTKVVEIFNQDINSAKPMSYMTEFNNFCSSATGVPDDPNFVCSNAGDWDIVTDIDHTRNMGFDRLLNKYLSIMANNTSALSQGPFWQMEANKPPRLINFD